MTAKTELLLYRLQWLAGKAWAHNFQDLSTGFEAWAYQSGFLKQIQRLEAQELVESQIDSRTGKRLHRLTEAGVRAAGGGRDPVAAWSGKWDRKWRLFLFDIPEGHRAKRLKLTRALHAAGCGCLQRSVWISARNSPELEELVTGQESDCSQLLLLYADSKGAATDKRMVSAAWDFDRINGRYNEVSTVLDEFRSVSESATPPEALRQWTEREHYAWKSALRLDPLLPTELLPRGYLGRNMWEKRTSVLRHAAQWLASQNQSKSLDTA